MTNGFFLAELPPGRAITIGEIDNLIRYVAEWLVNISLIIAVIMIVVSGIMYMTAGDSSDKVKKAIATLKGAVIGTAIVFGVGIIIDTIALAVTRGAACRFGIVIPFLGVICF